MFVKSKSLKKQTKARKLRSLSSPSNATSFQSERMTKPLHIKIIKKNFNKKQKREKPCSELFLTDWALSSGALLREN